jgi:hypothetical protein
MRFRDRRRTLGPVGISAELSGIASANRLKIEHPDPDLSIGARLRGCAVLGLCATEQRWTEVRKVRKPRRD